MSPRSLGWLLISMRWSFSSAQSRSTDTGLQAAEFILAVAALVVGAAILILSVQDDGSRLQDWFVPTYRLHDTTGDDLGLIEHPAPNVEPGDVLVLPDGREALVTARVEAEPGPLAALLEVVIAPSRLEADDALP